MMALMVKKTKLVGTTTVELKFFIARFKYLQKDKYKQQLNNKMLVDAARILEQSKGEVTIFYKVTVSVQI